MQNIKHHIANKQTPINQSCLNYKWGGGIYTLTLFMQQSHVKYELIEIVCQIIAAKRKEFGEV